MPVQSVIDTDHTTRALLSILLVCCAGVLVGCKEERTASKDQTTLAGEAKATRTAKATGEEKATGKEKTTGEPAAASSCESDWIAKVEQVADLGHGYDRSRFAVDDQHIAYLSSFFLRVASLEQPSASAAQERFAGGAGAVGLRDGQVYWTSSSRFQRTEGAIRVRDVGKQVSKARVLASRLQAPISLVVGQEGELRWIDWEDGGLYRPDGKGGPGVKIASAGNGMSFANVANSRLVADDTHLFFSRIPRLPDRSSTQDAIVRTDWSGQEEQVLALGQTRAIVLLLDTTDVYWVADGTIRRVAKSGGPVQDVASVGRVAAMFRHGDFLYYMQNRGIEPEATLRRVAIAGDRQGDEPEVLHTSAIRRSHVVQKTKDALYWLEYTIPPPGSECEELNHQLLKRGQAHERAAELEAVCASMARDQLMRMALPRC